MLTLRRLVEACQHKPVAVTLAQLEAIPEYRFARLELYPDPFMFAFRSVPKSVEAAEVFARRNGMAVVFSPNDRLFVFFTLENNPQ